MRGVNKVIIVGNLGNDPETRQFSNGGSVTNISVATSEQWTDKQTGEKREATEWHRIVLFNRLGEIAAQYLRKGSKVYIEGSLRTRKWQDQNGQDKYTTEIRADQMQMLDGATGGQGGGGFQGNNHNGGNQNNQGGSYNNNNQGSNYGGSQPNNQGGYAAQGNNNQGGGNDFNNQNSALGNTSPSNQNSFGSGGAPNTSAPQPAQNAPGFNDKTSGNLGAMNDTPTDDDIPF